MKYKSIAFTLIFLVSTIGNAIPQRADAIQTTLDKSAEKYYLPGVQIAIKKEQDTKTQTFASGQANINTQQSLDVNHLMQIGSTTKSFIANVLLQLEAESESGRLGLDFSIEQPMGHWLTQFPDWKNIKIKQLLNMTSGIYNYTEVPEFFAMLVKDPNHRWQAQRLIDFAYNNVPNTNFSPGKGWHYSNTNYILAGLIIEKITGQKLETVMQERLFTKFPQKFTHTHYTPISYPDGYMNQMAHGYANDPEKNAPLYGKDITDITLSWAGAAGGIVSNANDLNNWVTLLFKPNFLPQKQLDELITLTCTEKKECTPGEILAKDSHITGYGLGIARFYDENFGNVWTHTGGTLGYHSLFLYIPSIKLSMAVIINQIGPQINGEDDVMLVANDVLRVALQKPSLRLINH
jgi:D-alanyl-D-alanine carboxypeptidase